MQLDTRLGTFSMKNFIVLAFQIFIPFILFSSAIPLEQTLRKIDDKIKVIDSQIKNIDFIYLINLDKRTDRLEASQKQLFSYNIHPYRFSAVYGKQLSLEELNSIGLRFTLNMNMHQWVFTPSASQGLKSDFLRTDSDGKVFFSRYTNLGNIGCAFSHLSILQDAFEAGYEVIWVMEDDILINDDPHKLTQLINKLDALTEKSWDILYTDPDEFKDCIEIEKDFWWEPRPDFPCANRSDFCKRSIISEDFIKIGSRTRTHSMILKRSGIKKILDHIKYHGLFFPYDHEIGFVEGIQLYMLRYPLVSWMVSPSDIQVTEH
jgi:GR25 family glycosyltransferase involved in LPS biosynthesis